MQGLFEPVFDLTKSPYVTFSASELPEHVYDKIHDLPDFADQDAWRELRRRYSDAYPGVKPSFTVIPPDLVRSKAEHDWMQLRVPHDYETEETPAEYFERQGFEFEVRATQESGKEWILDLDWGENAARTSDRAHSIGWNVMEGDQGYHIIDLSDAFRIVPPENLKKTRKRPYPGDPLLYSGYLRGLLCSREVEAKLAEFTGGLIDTIDLPFTDNSECLPSVWRGRRLVSVLARWQPFDLEKSVIEWRKRDGRFEIFSVPHPVLRTDLPPEISMIRPAHRKAKVLLRRSAVTWLDAHNNYSGGIISYGLALRVPPDGLVEAPKYWRGEERPKPIWKR